MKRVRALAGAMSVAAALGIAACGSTTEEARHYSPGVRAEFLANCTDKGVGMAATCKCMLARLEETVDEPTYLGHRDPSHADSEKLAHMWFDLMPKCRTAN